MVAYGTMRPDERSELAAWLALRYSRDASQEQSGPGHWGLADPTAGTGSNVSLGKYQRRRDRCPLPVMQSTGRGRVAPALTALHRVETLGGSLA